MHFQPDMPQQHNQVSQFFLYDVHDFFVLASDEDCHAKFIFDGFHCEEFGVFALILGGGVADGCHVAHCPHYLFLCVGVQLVHRPHNLLYLESHLQLHQMLNFDPRNDRNGGGKELVIELLLDVALQEDQVDLQSLAVRNQLGHFLGSVVHDIFKRSLLFAANQVSRFQPSIDQQAADVLVFVFDFLVDVVALDEDLAAELE